jgi:hypothetical protein
MMMLPAAVVLLIVCCDAPFRVRNAIGLLNHKNTEHTKKHKEFFVYLRALVPSWFKKPNSLTSRTSVRRNKSWIEILSLST